MATNWGIETKTKSSTTDNFTVETFTKSFGVGGTLPWEDKSVNWEDVLSYWSAPSVPGGWTISGKATAGDSD